MLSLCRKNQYCLIIFGRGHSHVIPKCNVYVGRCALQCVVLSVATWCFMLELLASEPVRSVHHV